MLENTNLILLSFALSAIIFTSNLNQCVAIRSFPSGTIREENYIIHKNQQVEAGKEKSKNEKIKKVYSNKEFVFEQDDEDEHDVTSSSEAGKLINQVKVVENNNINQLSKPDPKPKLERQQRTDVHNKNFEELAKHDRLKSFHKNKKLQENFLRHRESNYNFDYNLMLENLLLKDTDLFQDEMTNKDLGSSFGSKKFKDLDEENMNTNRMFKANRNSLKKQKPAKLVEVEENLLQENDYNKQFIQDPVDGKNPFFNKEYEDYFKNIKLSVKEEPIKQSSHAINSIPSLVNKQANTNVDSNINAKIDQIRKQNDYLFMFVVAGCALAGVVAFVAAGVCWYTVYRSSKVVGDEFGSKSGKINPGSASKLSTTSSGDRRLAQSAQMYHYQHQKQQMIAMEKANNDTKPENSDNSEGETEEGDYTVYECPGLAPTGEMEVKNPLFKEEFTASSSNLYSSMPPSYSAIASAPVALSPKEQKLIDIEESKDVETKEKSDAVTIEINENKPVNN